MLNLVYNGKVLESTITDSILEILDSLRDFSEVDCNFYRGEKGLKQLLDEFKFTYSTEEETLKHLELKESDFINSEVFTINCYKPVESSKLFGNLITTKAFVFANGEKRDFSKILIPFFGETLKIEGFEE